MSDDKATPRPWEYDYTEIHGPYDAKTHSADTVVGMNTYHHGYESSSELVLSSANTALIVRAVNAHDALVKACEAALDLFEGQTLIEGRPNASVRKQLCAALALARGEK